MDYKIDNDVSLKGETSSQNSIVYLTGADGIKRDKTNQIADITYDAITTLYTVRFKGSDKQFRYKRQNVQIIKNAIAKVRSRSVFSYLKRVAALSDIKNDNNENILTRIYESIDFVNADSVLARYLNADGTNIRRSVSAHPIFPFGCNRSQYAAVKTALENSLSVIQGPPGTGKTQTILNIIANLILSGNKVLVVSNNNSALDNVREKLSDGKCNLSFLVAMLGRSENVSEFLKSQEAHYPAELNRWTVNIDEARERIRIGDLFDKLKSLFDLEIQAAESRDLLDRLKLEYKHFLQETDTPSMSFGKTTEALSSDEVMELWQKIRAALRKDGNISLWYKFVLFVSYGIGSWKFWKTPVNEVLRQLKTHYYKVRIREQRHTIDEAERLRQAFCPNAAYAAARGLLRHSIGTRYGSKTTRHIFTDGELSKGGSELYDEYPIVLSTTFSSRRCLPYRDKDFLFDYLIMDEASQVDVATGALALSCARNAVIVGDDKQLPNVVTSVGRIKAQEVFEGYSINAAYDFTKHSFLSSITTLFPDVPQTMLCEHYRCHPKIINFCNQKFYGNRLVIMTKDNGEDDVIQVFKTNIGNHCRGHENQRQVDVIINDIMPKLSCAKQEDTGIIAPYRDQAGLISCQMNGIMVDTVHKFQGREKDNIIISSTDDQISQFADDPNLLNVAISRAKKHLYFVVSGNEQSSDTNISDFVSYVQYTNCEVSESGVNSIFDYLYSQYTLARLNYLKSHGRISNYDSENLMYGLLCDILHEERFSTLGVLFEQPLHEIVGRSLLHSLSSEERAFAQNDMAHVDFMIYSKISKQPVLAIEVDGYRFHKKGTRQSARDAIKNRILSLCGIKFLRLSTTGSNEREKIIALLESKGK